MRVVLFTDTLGDVNGVSRFIRNMDTQAHLTGKSLHVLTSTRLTIPDRPTLINIPPRYAQPMPGYPNLELAWPDGVLLGRWCRWLKPDAIHISTPGPVGVLGRRLARQLGIPLVATYHTDFPAYVNMLLDDRVLDWICTRVMKWFYRPFDLVLTRSGAYRAPVMALGLPEDRVVTLRPGIDTATFSPGPRDDALMSRLGCPSGSVRVLYAGRVSVEKNLPMLAAIWPGIAERARSAGVPATLVVVGDGPYLADLRARLSTEHAVTLGFRHGAELLAIYRSCDLFAFPSMTDTLGQSVMEAQACALPALVGDVGGPSEVVDHDQTGLVLPAGNARAWSDALLSLILDTARRQRLSTAAAQRMAPRTIRASFEHWWSLHELAVARRQHPTGN